MSDLLSIGGNSVKNNQSALTVVSNNIANVHTDGYVRQDLSLQENLPTKNGLVYLGTGALAAGIKRSYDGLVEASLRTSRSDLSAQQPIIKFTDRIIDVFGDEKSSLTPAIGSFFDSLRSLSLDASSELLRSQVLGEAKGVASRLNDLASQLMAIDQETRDVTQSKMGTFNVLATELAGVNTKLNRYSDVNKQPPDLLDMRDELLRQMSGLLKISVEELSSGQVNVNVGDSSSQAQVVSGSDSTEIGVRFLEGTPPRNEILLDPFRNPKNLSGLTGGEIGGLLNFREQLLEPKTGELNDIANALMREVNATHAKGMDMFQQPGGTFFESPPLFDINYSLARGSAQLSVTRDQESDANVAPLSFLFDEKNNRWIVEDINTGNKFASAAGAKKIAINGLTIGIEGKPIDGDFIRVQGNKNPAASIQVKLTDPRQIAAGDLFRVSTHVENTGGATSSIRLSAGSSEAPAATTVSDLLVNNPHSSAAKTVSGTYSKPLLTLPPGTSDLELLMGKATNSSIELQVFSTDGRHLFGSSLTADQQSVMLTEQNGFSKGAGYSSRYLNGSEAYLDKEWYFGAFGTSVSSKDDAGATIIDQEATISGSHIPALTNTTGATMTVIAGGALKLGGVAMGALELASGATLDASKVLTWLNNHKSANGLGYEASAKNEIRISASSLSTTTGLLNINGTEVHNATAITSVNELVTSINSKTAATNVEARIDFDGAIILSNTPGNEASKIAFGNTPGVLTGITGDYQSSIIVESGRGTAAVKVSTGVTNTYGAGGYYIQKADGTKIEFTTKAATALDFQNQIRTVTQDSNFTVVEVDGGTDHDDELKFTGPKNFGDFEIFKADGTKITGGNATAEVTGVRDVSEKSLALTLTATGSATDLAKIGMRTGVYLPDTLDEELIVFASGSTADSASLAASYNQQEANALYLRESPLEIEFTDTNRYQITDSKTGTVLAERIHTPGDLIKYQNIEIELLGQPAIGDKFAVDNNSEGFGSNDNVVRLVDIESSKIIGDNQTLHEGYLGLLNDAGNTSRQGKIAQQALEVVYDQAVESRDSIAGVNLDEEAANLIRFQQAYQASARLIQTANQLFDSILRL